VTRKIRPAMLTSTLLARKGEAEPAHLADGSVPRDVIALQEELVARVADDIARQAAPGIPAVSAEMKAAASGEGPPPEELDEDEDDDPLGAAPVELPAGSADEPDYDPDEDAAVAQESQITLADWTARAQSGDSPFAYERMSDPQKPERSAFIPLALGVAVAAVLATLVIWQVSDHGRVFPEGAQTGPAALPATALPEPAEPAPAPAPAEPTQAAAAALEPAAPASAPKAVAPKAAAPKAAAPEAKPQAASAAVTGDYAVQLVSTLSQETAERAWNDIAAKVAAAGLKAPHAIDRADLGAKGTRYRVKLTGFASYGAGQKACETLKAHRLSCLVVHN
jgi:SPOR domain